MGFLDLVKQFARPHTSAPAAPQSKTSLAGPMIAWSGVGQPKWTPRRYESLAEEGFRKNVIAYRCVMQIATAGAAVPWLLYDDEGSEIDRHPLLTLLRHPNPTQDGVSFLENIYAYLEIAGNAYVEAVKPAANGQPYELYVLRPDRMKVIPGPAGLPQGYQYTVNGQVTTWAADPITGASNILHLKRFHPLDDWYGMPPMEAALVSIDQHNAASAWNQSLLNQGARPSGALVYAPKDGPGTLTDDQMQRLREEMSQMYQGNRNAGRPLILEGGLDWREMSLSPKDMDWLAGRNTAARDIAQAFGVPSQLVGIPDAQTYANMAEARMAFYEETVLPLITRVIAGVDHWLTPMFDDRLELDFDPDRISALGPRRDAQWAKLQNTGFLTPNEKREAVGYGPVEGGDSLFGARKLAAVVERRSRSSYNAGHTRYAPTPASKDDDDGGDFLDDGGDALPDNALDPGADTGTGGDTVTNLLDTWGDPDTLQRHVDDHGDDFGVDTPEGYADVANQFYQRFLDEDLPAVWGGPEDNRTRVYEPETNTFGTYNPDDTTATFFKPKEGIDYYMQQVERDLDQGGRVINPLASDIYGGGGSGGIPHMPKPGLDLDPFDDELE